MDANTKQNKTDPTRDLYDEILTAYQYFNDQLFEGQLPKSLITLQRQSRTKGYVSNNRWVNTTPDAQKIDELAINPEYWMGWPVAGVFATLVHEQCHVWQCAFGKPGRNGYHNKEWGNKMKEVGLIPTSTGRPDGKETGDSVTHYIALNGRFHKSLVNLLDDGFTLSWLDRAALPCTSDSVILDSDGKPYNLNGTPISIDEGQSTESLSTDGARVIVEVPPPKRVTRTKYICQCGTKIWGKPGLWIMCRKCELDFVPEGD